MTRILSAGAALLLSTSIAAAGGIERGLTNYGILFEDGNYVELGFSSVSPNVSGDYDVLLGGGSTGDMANDYTQLSLSYKHQLTDQLAIGLFLNQPYGAIAEYSSGAYTGLEAEWESTGTTLILKYDINSAWSVYGGARYVVSSADITIPTLLATLGAEPPAIGDFAATGESDGQTSFIAGVAYQRPEIALRVSLTYEQGFTHEFDTTEEWGVLASTALGTPFESVTEVEMPEAITLDFQTGIAQDTLLFGSIRHVKWSVWEVRTQGFDTLTGNEITGFDNDTTTFTVGVGRRINDQFSVFGRARYEEAKGGIASRLSPTDGLTSIGIGGTYAMDNVEFTAGVEYIMIGDAEDGSATDFSDNDAIGFGLTIGYGF